MTGRFDVFALFPTPIVHFEVPDSVALNADLKAVIERQQKFDTGTEISNFGGWQSVDTAKAFADYAGYVSANLGDRTAAWLYDRLTGGPA